MEPQKLKTDETSNAPEQLPHPGPQLEDILLNPGELKSSSASRAPAGDVLKDQESPFVLSSPAARHDIPTRKHEEGVVRPLQTYQGDIQDVVQKQNVSIVSIAAAEAERRSKEPIKEKGSPLTRIALILGSILLIAAAAGGLAYVLLYQTSTPAPKAPISPIISVDTTQEVAITPTMSAADILQSLQVVRSQNDIPLGLVKRIVVTQQGHVLDGQTFLSLLTPAAPQAFIRSVQPTYVLGLHAFSGNRPFLILTVDSYAQGFSGMLAWEQTMQGDLAPFFTDVPAIAATSTATTTPQLLKTPFVDAILENHDVREIQTSDGSPILLWTFLNPKTILIATNATTLHEVIFRLTQ